MGVVGFVCCGLSKKKKSKIDVQAEPVPFAMAVFHHNPTSSHRPPHHIPRLKHDGNTHTVQRGLDGVHPDLRPLCADRPQGQVLQEPVAQTGGGLGVLALHGRGLAAPEAIAPDQWLCRLGPAAPARRLGAAAAAAAAARLRHLQQRLGQARRFKAAAAAAAAAANV